MRRPIVNQRNTKRDPFAAEIALRLEEKRRQLTCAKSPWKMTLSEIIREIDRCASMAAGLARRA